MTTIPVAIAAPYPMTRVGLAAIVRGSPDLHVTDEAATLDELIAGLDESAPQAALLDPGEETDTWLDTLWRLADTATLPPVVLLAGSTDLIRRLPERPITGILLRDATPDEIAAALRAVVTGLIVLDPRIAEQIVGGDLAPSGDLDVTLAAPLSARELQVLQLIARGQPNKVIAAELGISEHTVKFHVGSILQKLGAASRAEALALAARAGLIAL